MIKEIAFTLSEMNSIQNCFHKFSIHCSDKYSVKKIKPLIKGNQVTPFACSFTIKQKLEDKFISIKIEKWAKETIIDGLFMYRACITESTDSSYVVCKSLTSTLDRLVKFILNSYDNTTNERTSLYMLENGLFTTELETKLFNKKHKLIDQLWPRLFKLIRKANYNLNAFDQYNILSPQVLNKLNKDICSMLKVMQINHFSLTENAILNIVSITDLSKKQIIKFFESIQYISNKYMTTNIVENIDDFINRNRIQFYQTIRVSLL